MDAYTTESQVSYEIFDVFSECPELTIQGTTSPYLHQSSLKSLVDHQLFAPTTSQPISLANARSVPLPTPFQGLDLLVLPTSPPDIASLSPSFPSTGITLGQLPAEVRDLLIKSRPRYLFWADSQAFWEREPFGWTGIAGQEERWTRTVKLGALGGEAEGKKPRVSCLIIVNDVYALLR